MARWRDSARRVAIDAESLKQEQRMSTEQTLDPNRLTVEQTTQLLSATSRKPMSIEMLQQDIEAGAPTNSDGTINLVHYAAWLVKEAGRGD